MSVPDNADDPSLMDGQEGTGLEARDEGAAIAEAKNQTTKPRWWRKKPNVAVVRGLRTWRYQNGLCGAPSAQAINNDINMDVLLPLCKGRGCVHS